MPRPGQWQFGRSRKNVPSKEAVAGVVNDIYMKMQVHTPPEMLLPQRPVAPVFNHPKPPIKPERPSHADTKCPCLCGQPFLPGNVVKCEDCRGTNQFNHDLSTYGSFARNTDWNEEGHDLRLHFSL